MTTNMYQDVERSLWMALESMKLAMGWTYPIFNQMITKKDFGTSHAALSILKISDVPNFQNGGGTQAKLVTVKTVDANGKPAIYAYEPWPQYYDLLYQLTVLADNVDDARNLDYLIRRALPPRKGLQLYNSETSAYTGLSLDTSYAGYIARDVPEDYEFWRITNYRVETPDFTPELAVDVPALTSVQMSTAIVAAVDGPVDIVISEL